MSYSILIGKGAECTTDPKKPLFSGHTPQSWKLGSRWKQHLQTTLQRPHNFSDVSHLSQPIKRPEGTNTRFQTWWNITWVSNWCIFRAFWVVVSTLGWIWNIPSVSWAIEAESELPSERPLGSVGRGWPQEGQGPQLAALWSGTRVLSCWWNQLWDSKLSFRLFKDFLGRFLFWVEVLEYSQRPV